LWVDGRKNQLIDITDAFIERKTREALVRMPRVSAVKHSHQSGANTPSQQASHNSDPLLNMILPAKLVFGGSSPLPAKPVFGGASPDILPAKPVFGGSSPDEAVLSPRVSGGNGNGKGQKYGTVFSQLLQHTPHNLHSTTGRNGDLLFLISRSTK
jgi:hypothetical protein